MKKYFLVSSSFLIFFFRLTAASYSAVTEPAVYAVTVKKIEISQDGGATYITVASGNRAFSLASSQPHGQIINDYVSGVLPPEGSYDTMRLTLSNAITLSGKVVQNAGLNAGTTFCTGGAMGAACAPVSVAVTLTNALVAAAGLVLPSGMTINDATSEIVLVSRSNTIEIGSGAQSSYKISFDTTAQLIIEPDDTIHPGVPNIAISPK